MAKFKRLPNKFGSISKMSGKRRNPYRVRVPDGISIDLENEKATRKYKYLGYYPTYTDALYALTEYNKDPHSIEPTITFSDVYERWSEESYPTMKNSSKAAHSAAYKVFSPLYDRPFKDVKYQDYMTVMMESGKNYPMLLKGQILLTHLYDWAEKNELQITNQSKFVDVSAFESRQKDKLVRIPFTDDEITKLWKHSDDSNTEIALMLLYTGVRTIELLSLEKEDVYINDRYFRIKDSKSAAGHRVVPIADKVYPMFLKHMDSKGPMLIYNRFGRKIPHSNFGPTYFEPVLDLCGCNPDHKPHDTRHTFVTKLKLLGVDLTIIKKIVGHKGDVTEDVYTHIPLEVLLDTVNKL